MQWQIEPGGSRGWWRVTTSGPFSPQEHVQMVREITEHPEWLPGADVLFDHRDLELGGATFETMFRAVQTHRAFEERIGDGRAAILVGTRAAPGSARPCELLLGEGTATRFNVLLDEAEAIRWLED